MSTLRTLIPAMGVTPAPTWPGARWIGSLDRAQVESLADRVELQGGAGFGTARFLIRDGLAVAGFVEVPVMDGTVAAVDLRSELALLPVRLKLEEVPLPPMTIALSTRNRPDNIAPLVRTLLSADYPVFEIVVVDNASDDASTLLAARSINDTRLRVVREPLPGLSRGRNTALLEARHDLVAFVDDDVMVDPQWLRGLARGFAQSSEVGVVTGMVPSGELLTEAQGYFESRIGWAVDCESRFFSRADPPADIPLFPFEVGVYGTGANFAVRRDLVLELGGFNEALGVGSQTGGGEDIDVFVRLLYAGYALAYEPTSVVWHRHRRETDELARQMRSYGKGFGAWITTVLLDPQMRPDALRLLGKGLRRARTVAVTDGFDEPARPDLPDGVSGEELRRSEILGMASGPYWYARARWDRRLARPLAKR